MKHSGKRIIGYTLGDQSGIGPEVITKALASQQLNQDVAYKLIGHRVDVPIGIPNEVSARYAYEHLLLATKALKSGEIDAIVTAPVCKDTLHQVGFDYPGQTEFFADQLHVKNYAMCLSGEHLTVGLASIHTALKNVPEEINTVDLVRIALLLTDFCHKKGISHPNIALAGLNPHAGEEGAFGLEEELFIRPAISELKKLGLDASFFGPEVPDCVYRDAYEGKFDAVLAPYHDQGLIPLKLVDFHTAVNITLGLPRPRISPDHGTAFAIAGKDIANPSSTLHAFNLAAKIALSSSQNH